MFLSAHTPGTRSMERTEILLLLLPQNYAPCVHVEL